MTAMEFHLPTIFVLLLLGSIVLGTISFTIMDYLGMFDRPDEDFND